MTPSYVYVAATVRAYVVLPTFILDLRSGSHKSPSVPPPRPYHRKKMVVHSPKKDARQPAGAVGGAASGTHDDPVVPPSVRAAATSAATSQQFEADLLGATGGGPASSGAKIEVQADVHAVEGEEIRRQDNGLTPDSDTISVAGSVPDAPPPPPPSNSSHPQLNPFTPEWFERMIGAAATAAATAAIASSAATSPRPPPSAPPSNTCLLYTSDAADE